MEDIKLSCGTIYEYDASAVDSQDDPETPLCVASIDGKDTVFISPLPESDENRFIAVIDGNKMKFKTKEDLLNEVELDLVDKETSDKFFDMCDEWLGSKKESMHIVSNRASNAERVMLMECNVEGTKYSYDTSHGLYINDMYVSTLPYKEADSLFKTLQK